jgi:hypothetical protein
MPNMCWVFTYVAGSHGTKVTFKRTFFLRHCYILYMYVHTCTLRALCRVTRWDCEKLPKNLPYFSCQK